MAKSDKEMEEFFAEGKTLTVEDVAKIDDAMANWAADHNVCFGTYKADVIEMHIYQIEGELEGLLVGYPVIGPSKDKKHIEISSAYGHGKENEIICSAVTVERY